MGRKRQSFSGENGYKKALAGKKMNMKEAILAKCYDCMASYIDGRQDCEIPDCPLYRWMPYKEKK